MVLVILIIGIVGAVTVLLWTLVLFAGVPEMLKHFRNRQFDAYEAHRRLCVETVLWPYGIYCEFRRWRDEMREARLQYIEYRADNALQDAECGGDD